MSDKKGCAEANSALVQDKLENMKVWWYIHTTTCPDDWNDESRHFLTKFGTSFVWDKKSCEPLKPLVCSVRAGAWLYVWLDGVQNPLETTRVMWVAQKLPNYMQRWNPWLEVLGGVFSRWNPWLEVLGGVFSRQSTRWPNIKYHWTCNLGSGFPCCVL
jgi:hypothetical protein